MPTQKSGGQILTALQHTIPEACQNFSGTWEVCAKIKKHFQLLILMQLSGRTQACLRWNMQYGVNLPSCCQDGPGGQVQVKTDEAKESTRERAKQEQRWSKNQRSRGRAGTVTA